MKVYLREITEQGKHLSFDQNEKWVADAVARADEDAHEFSPRHSLARPIQTDILLRRVDTVVMISGKIHTEIRLLCSRCAARFPLPVRSQFSALYCQDPSMAGIAHLEQDDNGIPVPMGRNQGFARHSHDFSEDSGWGEDSETGGKDVDITYISEDFIELGDVLTEQVALQIPFQPLCRSDCKGICPHCGADWNTGRCACAKLVKSSPFSVLKDFKPGSR